MCVINCACIWTDFTDLHWYDQRTDVSTSSLRSWSWCVTLPHRSWTVRRFCVLKQWYYCPLICLWKRRHCMFFCFLAILVCATLRTESCHSCLTAPVGLHSCSTFLHTSHIVWYLSDCMCLCVCVRYTDELCKNGWTDWAVVWGTDSCEGPDPSPWEGNFWACAARLAHSAKLPTGLYILPMFFFIFVMFDFRDPVAQNLMDRASPKFCIELFWFFKGRCHGNKLKSKNWRFSQTNLLCRYARSFVSSGAVVDCWQSFDVPSATAS